MADVPPPDHVYTILVPALSGLLGTIAGVLANAVSAKWSDDRRLRQDRLRARDQDERQAKTLRAILRSELASMSSTFYSEKLFAEDTQNQSTYVPLIAYLNTLRKDLSGLGLLHPTEAEAVMTAFYVYQERTWYIRNNAAHAGNAAVCPADEPVTYDLSNVFFRGCLVNDLRNIVEAADIAVWSLDQPTDDPTHPTSELLRKLVQGRSSDIDLARVRRGARGAT